MISKNNKLYIWGILCLTAVLALPFIIDWFNPWPSLKRLGAAVAVCGFVFSFFLAVFWERKMELAIDKQNRD